MRLLYIIELKMRGKKFMPEFKDWMRMAESDLETAYFLLNAREESLGYVFYLAQQGAEKALKSYMLFNGMPIIKTHDLMGLLEKCINIEPNFEKFKYKLSIINPYSTATRYPDDHFVMPDVTTARLLLNDAQELFEFVQDKLNA